MSDARHLEPANFPTAILPPPVLRQPKTLTPATPAPDAMPSPTPFANSAVILVVDDQERNLKEVQRLLAYDGYHVMTAQNAEETYRCLGARKPDLILLDVIMPDTDGFSVCERVKAEPQWQDVPIIFLSGDSEHQSVMKGFALGGVDYVRKPFNKAELLARVRTHVELKRAHERHAKQLNDKQRTLDLIAHEWHKPLQRIALILSKVKEIGGTARGNVMSELGAEALRETDKMLNSIENFLHEDNVDVAISAPTAHGRLTTDDLKMMAGKWYVTAKRKLIELKVVAPSTPISLSGPQFAVHQIVDAVMSNAVNFTPRGGQVEVQIGPEADAVCLRVLDDGPGFSVEYLSRKFQPFLRGGEISPRGSASSLGVGLAAAKRIADRIQASLTAANRTDGGACVAVAFQKAARQPLAPPVS